MFRKFTMKSMSNIMTVWQNFSTKIFHFFTVLCFFFLKIFQPKRLKKKTQTPGFFMLRPFYLTPEGKKKYRWLSSFFAFRLNHAFICFIYRHSWFLYVNTSTFIYHFRIIVLFVNTLFKCSSFFSKWKKNALFVILIYRILIQTLLNHFYFIFHSM